MPFTGGSASLLKCRIIDSTADLLVLQPEWEALRKECRGSIFMSFDWAIEWLRHFDKVVSPRIMLVEDGDEIVAIAPFVVMEHRAMGLKMKKLSLVGNGAGVAELYDLGILWRGDRDEVLDALVEGMGDLDWNVLQLNEMREDEMSSALHRRAGELWETDEAVRIPCPCTELPAGGDVSEVISSRTRRTIRKAISTLEADSRIGYRCVDLPDEAAEAAAMYALQHVERWEDRQGSIFTNQNLSGFLRDVMMATVQEGRGMIYEVWIDGSLASQMLCLEDRDVMRAYRVGMTNRFSEYSPGNLVAFYAMTEAQKAGFTHFDFGAGPEEFKYRLGAKDRPLMRIQAKRGGMRAAAKLSSLPGVKQIIDRSGARDQALRVLYECGTAPNSK
ncbi:GNAT family N-acetyltransferase [Methanomassiliicoccus luminyensis]|uniref:GNAT family N-acetyltransferase n=1 Tax=Methanomassiliicoccus luminyensis TaxID=1080712 RepID=UPI00037B0ADF|nr:GNAT family N-acetyltransferase [Methanomassiliicoccus luminyensis]